VQRQYSGTLGKTANCQLGVSVNAVTEHASCPLDWRLVVPERWDEEAMTTRRAACRLPEGVHHRPKWQLVLDMLDELAGWELVPPVVLADSGYGEVGEFRAGLDARQTPYVVEVRSDTSAHPERVRPRVAPSKGRGRRPRPRYRDQPSSLKDLATAAGEQARVELIWRRGSRGLQRGRFLALGVRPAGVTPRRLARQDGGELPVRWLLERVAGRQGHPDQVLAVEPARGHPAGGAGRSGQVAVASGAGLPRAQRRPWAGPLRGSRLGGLAPPRHAGLGRARLPDPGAAPLPKPAASA
jgi:DDE superfamily endonuclease